MYLSQENAYNKLKDEFENEIKHHKEAQNCIKVLEEKLKRSEDNFTAESNKSKRKKETLATKINDSKKEMKVDQGVKAVHDNRVKVIGVTDKCF